MKRTVELIAKNIKHLRSQKKGLSQEKFAEDLEISVSRLSAYETGRNEPSIQMLRKISDYFKVSIDALIRIDLSTINKKELINIGGRMLFPIQVDDSGNNLIEVVTAKTQAGYLNGYSDPEFISKLLTMSLPFKVVGKTRAFPITGDSMPPVEKGDFVIGRYLESIFDIKKGNTYIIHTKDEGLVYKRVVPYLAKNGGYIELFSDNLNYPKQVVKAEDILEVWEYVSTLKGIGNKPEQTISIDGMISLLKQIKIEG